MARWLALLALLWPVPQEDPWAGVWSDLEGLRGGAMAEAEAALVRARLGEALQRSGTSPRAELLGAELEVLAGRDASALARRLATLEPSPFTPREQWFLADLLAPGEARVRAVRAALETPANLQRWQFFLAWNTAVDEARNLRYVESALPIQLELHRRYQAEWSAIDLAQSYRALGDRASAERILSEAIAKEEAAGRRARDLWEQRGRTALAFGDEVEARDYLGMALILGSRDAALLLARLDLAAGRVAPARRAFRAHILTPAPPDWGWRGWGTTLLPGPFSPAAPAPASNRRP